MISATAASPHKIAVAAHPRIPESIHEAGQVAEFLRAQGVEVTAGLLTDEQLSQQVQNHEVDMLVALGGDGTMLRAGHVGAMGGVPVLGINMGHFGFLIEVQQDQWRQTLPQLLEGQYWIERRMMLRAEHRRGEALLQSWDVLNEIVVGRGEIIRPVHLVTHVDGRYLTTYVADALIASTPTGSTAYALAAGGPILPPELRNILIIAVAPHLSVDRAIVLSEGATVSIAVEANHQAVVSVDGQNPIALQNGDRMEARASNHSVEFIRFQDPGYFYRNLTIHMNRNPSIGRQA